MLFQRQKLSMRELKHLNYSKSSGIQLSSLDLLSYCSTSLHDAYALYIIQLLYTKQSAANTRCHLWFWCKTICANANLSKEYKSSAFDEHAYFTIEMIKMHTYQ